MNNCHKCGDLTVHASEGKPVCLRCLRQISEETLRRFAIVGPAAVLALRRNLDKIPTGALDARAIVAMMMAEAKH
jgi:hypothetical protein